jgi:ribonuclease VapC
LIVIDTSALMSLFLGESDCQDIAAVIDADTQIALGAPTKFEFLLVAASRFKEPGLKKARELLEPLGLDVSPWDETLAEIAADAFIRFGKGRHPAGLNFGDCMAYALAKSLDAPLLYKGGDFALTDLRSAL